MKPEAGGLVCRAIIERLANNLPGLGANPDMDKTFHLYGVDSLMAIKLKSWFANEFGADVPIFVILGESSFADLRVFTAQNSAFRREAWVE